MSAERPLAARPTVVRRAIIDVRLDGVTTAPILHAAVVAIGAEGQSLGQRELHLPVAELPPEARRATKGLIKYLKRWADGA